jgi:RimJ/RimL family protein N-acetyltransferase
MKKSTTVKKPTKAKKSTKAKRSAKTKASFYAQSKRLRFRLLESVDAALYYDLYTDAMTMKHVGPPLTRERAESSFQKALNLTQQKPFQLHISVIVERSGKPLGLTGLKWTNLEKRHAEGGVLLKPTAHAQRFASEATEILTAEAFKWHAIEELHAQVPIGHKPSERLVKGLGFSVSADLPAVENQPPRRLWIITRDTWARNQLTK